MRFAGFASLSLVILLNGCGYVGPILPPSPEIPATVRDLTAIERGGKIEISFHTPPRTTDGLGIKKFSEIDLRVGPTLTPFDFDSWSLTAKPIPVPPPSPADPLDPKPVSLSVSIPIQDFVGKHVALAVRTAIKHGDHYSAWSNRVLLEVTEPLAAPTAIKIAASAEGVMLDWPAVSGADRYRILRQGPEDAAKVEVGNTEKTHFVDTTSQFDVPYSYAVIALSTHGVESPASASLSITPVDTFPPSVPTAVTALAGPESIELSWQRSPEADLAGYLIYRSVGNGPFEKQGGVVVLPAFSDRSVEHGKTYRYQISSIDKNNNESAKSETVEVAF